MKMISASVVGTAVALAFAPPASADQYDYVSYLDNKGIYYSDILDVIDMGKQLCSVGRSAPLGQAMANGFGRIITGRGYALMTEGAIILTGAMNNMCPDILPRVEAAKANINAGNGKAASYS